MAGAWRRKYVLNPCRITSMGCSKRGRTVANISGRSRAGSGAHRDRGCGLCGEVIWTDSGGARLPNGSSPLAIIAASAAPRSKRQISQNRFPDAIVRCFANEPAAASRTSARVGSSSIRSSAMRRASGVRQRVPVSRRIVRASCSPASGFARDESRPASSQGSRSSRARPRSWSKARHRVLPRPLPEEICRGPGGAGRKAGGGPSITLSPEGRSAAGQGRFPLLGGRRSARTGLAGSAAFFSDAGFFGFLASRLDLLCSLAIRSSPRSSPGVR